MTDTARPTRVWDYVSSARLRIIGWMLLLTTLGLLAAGTAVLVVEGDRIDHRADRNIAQEFDELDRLIDGRPGRFGSAGELLERALERNVAQQYEIYVGIVDGEVRYVSYGPGGTASNELARDPAFVEAILDSVDGGVGSVETARGEVRYGVRPILQDDVRSAYVVAYLTDPWRGEFVSVMKGYALVAALTVLVVAAGGWLVAGRILRPVHDLEVTARGITETDLDGRIPVDDTGGDVSRLARTFNSMLDRVSGAFASQQQFLDDAGHELATPITILRGHLELLDAGDRTEVEETRELLLDELDRMDRLTRDLITLAKSERPDFVTRTPCDLDQLTVDALRLASGLGERRWQLDAQAEGMVLVDQQRVVQALLQLAANAVRYTAEGEEVGLGSRVVGSEVELWVRDTGPGVAPEEQAAIFDRFSRGSSASGTEGSGLGLAIVSAIAQAHGGRVTLDSAPGEGARFTLHLPAAHAASPPSPDPRTDEPPVVEVRAERASKPPHPHASA